MGPIIRSVLLSAAFLAGVLIPAAAQVPFPCGTRPPDPCVSCTRPTLTYPIFDAHVHVTCDGGTKAMGTDPNFYSHTCYESVFSVGAPAAFTGDVLCQLMKRDGTERMILFGWRRDYAMGPTSICDASNPDAICRYTYPGTHPWAGSEIQLDQDVAKMTDGGITCPGAPQANALFPAVTALCLMDGAVTVDHIRKRLEGSDLGPDGNPLPKAVWIGEWDFGGASCLAGETGLMCADASSNPTAIEIYKLAAQHNVPISGHLPGFAGSPGVSDGCGCDYKTFLDSVKNSAMIVGFPPPPIIQGHANNQLIGNVSGCPFTPAEKLDTDSCESIAHVVQTMGQYDNFYVELNAFRGLGHPARYAEIDPASDFFIDTPDFVKFCYEFADRIVIGRDNSGTFIYDNELWDPNNTKDLTATGCGIVRDSWVLHMESGLLELRDAMVALGIATTAQADCAVNHISHLNMERLMKLVPVACSLPFPRTQSYSGCPAPQFVTGIGPGPMQHTPQFVGWVYNGTNLRKDGLTLNAYATDKYGVNVAAGPLTVCPPNQVCINPDTASVITGPGPGPTFGPQVRGWDTLFGGSPITKLNYYAYGTLKYGVIPATGDIDGDLNHEILTGPGPGAVFGPHVRGWNYDGVKLMPMAKVSFFAYPVSPQTFGANVSTSDLDGDGFEEILTGPGPGPAAAARVRGFNYDGVAIMAIGPVNYPAYAGATNSFGVKVEGGDFDGDGFGDIVTAPGPRGNPSHGPFIQGWQALPTPSQKGLPITALGGSGAYGANISLGLVDDPLVEHLLVAQGPDPAQSSETEGYVWNSANARFDQLPGFDFAPYGNFSYGNTVAAPSGVPFRNGNLTSIKAGDDSLRGVRALIARAPDPTSVCVSCEDPGQDVNEWTLPNKKLQALDLMDALLAGMAGYTEEQVVETLELVRARVQEGLGNELARTEIVAAIDAMIVEDHHDSERWFLDTGLPSPAVTAIIPVEAPLGQVAYSNATDTMYVPRADQTIVSFGGGSLLERGTITPLSPEVLCIQGAPGQDEVYAVTAKPASGGQFKIFLERVAPTQKKKQIATMALPALRVAPLVAANPRHRPRNDAVYVCIRKAAGDGSRVFVVDGVSHWSTATITELRPDASLPVYGQLAVSPVKTDSRIFMIHDGGIDAIDTDAAPAGPSSIIFGALPGTGGLSIVGGERPDDHRVVYAARLSGAIEEWDFDDPSPGFENVASFTSFSGKMSLSRDGSTLVVPLISDPLEVGVIDTVTRTSLVHAIGGDLFATYEAAVPTDDSRAWVVNRSRELIDLLALHGKKLGISVIALRDTVFALPGSAFSASGNRHALDVEIRGIAKDVEKARNATNPNVRINRINDALVGLQDVRSKADGCAGGASAGDLITSCAAQALVLPILDGLVDELTAELPETIPPVIP